MTRVLVTGANGHVGANVVRSLLGRGYEVVPFVRRTSDLRGLDGLGLAYAYGDVMDRDSLLAAAEGCEVLVHTAAIYRLWAKDPEEIRQPALIGTQNALTAAKEAGIRRVVYTSSIWAIGVSKRPGEIRSAADWNEDARNPYAVAKMLSEKDAWRLADELGLAMISICPAAVLGPYDYRVTPSMDVLRGLINGTTPVAKSAMNFVAAHDVAEVHARAVEEGNVGERYIVAGPNLSIPEYAEIIERLLGIKLVRLPGGRTAMQIVAILSEFASRFTHSEPLLSRALADEIGDHNMHYDCDKTQQALGFVSREPEEMIKDGIRWLLHIGQIKPALAERLAEQFPPDPTWVPQQEQRVPTP